MIQPTHPSAAPDNRETVMQQAREILGERVSNFIAQCKAGEHPESRLIAVLHMVQEKEGYLPPEYLDAVAQLLQVPAAMVSGVASFYHFFRLQPRGTYMISLCMGTACYVKGADRVAQKLEEELGIRFGETTRDGLFTLDASRCLGTCGLAPVMTIENDVHSNVTPDQIPAILDSYIRKDRS
jgi:NADH-quinone oxidoreductase E subunit